MSSIPETPNTRKSPSVQLSLFDNDGQPIEAFRAIDEQVRKTQHNGQTYYSLVDICAVIAGAKWARDYWVETKTRLKNDGFQLSENLLQLKLVSRDSASRGAGRVLMLALADIANDDGVCCSSEDNLARKVNVSPRQLTRLIHECSRLGELRVIQQFVDGRSVSNLYQIVGACYE